MYIATIYLTLSRMDLGVCHPVGQHVVIECRTDHIGQYWGPIPQWGIFGASQQIGANLSRF